MKVAAVVHGKRSTFFVKYSPVIEHDRLPFSDILGALRVLSAPQLMFYLLPLALRTLKSGETYL